MGSRRRNFLKATGGIGLAAVPLTGCLNALNESSDDATITVSSSVDSSHIFADGIERWGESLSEESDGKFSTEWVEIGDEPEVINAASTGSIDAFFASTGALSEAYGPEYGFMGAPFVNQTKEHVDYIAENWLYAEGELGDIMIEQGDVRPLNHWYLGNYGVIGNFAIEEPSDLEGVPFRAPELPAWIDPWEAMGADVQPIPWVELYESLDRGMVDALNSEPQLITSSSLHEVTSHWSEIRHMRHWYPISINNEFYESLTDEEQNMLEDTLKDTTEWITEEYDKAEAESLDTMEDSGINTIPEDEINQDAFREAARPAIESSFEEDWKPSYDDVMSFL